MASQLARRVSSGWELSTCVEEMEVLVGPTPERSVSWRPGAEGADAEVRCVWVVEWPEAGAIRIACVDVSYLVEVGWR